MKIKIGCLDYQVYIRPVGLPLHIDQMDQALENAFSSKAFLKGLVVCDRNGLAIVSKGELDSSLSGHFSSITKKSASLDADHTTPTVLIETQERNILVKEYDSLTVVLKCSRS